LLLGVIRHATLQVKLSNKWDHMRWCCESFGTVCRHISSKICMRINL